MNKTLNQRIYETPGDVKKAIHDFGYEEGKKAAAEEIFRDLETIASIYQRPDNIRLVLEVAEMIGLKKKYGVK